MEFNTAKPQKFRKNAIAKTQNLFFATFAVSPQNTQRIFATLRWRLCGFLRLCGVFFDMIKFEHTIFALPFAYIGALLALNKFFVSSSILLEKLLWITLAMVTGRTCGMCVNRIVDRQLDAKNPRTSDWALPSGQFSVKLTKLIAYLAGILFILSSWRINNLCFVLSPIPIFLIVIYPYLKRITWLSHLVLGLILGCAPLGGWIAITDGLSFEPLLLSAAVIFWVAGFDIIYSLLDVDFDRRNSLFSIPANFGVEKGLSVSSKFHILTIIFLACLGISLKSGLFFWGGLIVFSIFLIYEHRLVKPSDFFYVNKAFFIVNGSASILFLIFVGLDCIVNYINHR